MTERSPAFFLNDGGARGTHSGGLINAPAAEPFPAPNPIIRKGCQYPKGARPHFNFCGAPNEPGKPYCAEHQALCWVKPKKPGEQ